MANNRNNNYYKPRKSGGKVWVGLTAFVLTAAVAVGVIGYGSNGFKDWSFEKLVGGNQEQTQEENEAKGEAIITETVSQGLSLMSTSIDPAAYEDYGVSAAADSAYTITATVSPATATFVDLNWSVAWDEDAIHPVITDETFSSNEDDWYYNSETETDHNHSTLNVSDFVTVLPTETGATVTCLQAFGFPIEITCQSVDNPNATATCKVDYQSAVNILNSGIINTSLSIRNNGSFSDSLNFDSTLGTLPPEFDISYSIRIGDFYIDGWERLVELTGSNIRYTSTNNSAYFPEFSNEELMSLFGHSTSTVTSSYKDFYGFVRPIDNINTTWSNFCNKYLVVNNANSGYEIYNRVIMAELIKYQNGLTTSVWNDDQDVLYKPLSETPLWIIDYTVKDKTFNRTSAITHYVYINSSSVSNIPVEKVNVNSVSINNSNLVFGI